MSKELTTEEAAKILDRAIELAERHVPVGNRSPGPGGGATLATAVGVLVALRAVVAAVAEVEAKGTP